MEPWNRVNYCEYIYVLLHSQGIGQTADEGRLLNGRRKTNNRSDGTTKRYSDNMLLRRCCIVYDKIELNTLHKCLGNIVRNYYGYECTIRLSFSLNIILQTDT